MLIENELENLIVSINGQKVCTSSSNIDLSVFHIPAEAASLLNALKAQTANTEIKEDKNSFVAPVTIVKSNDFHPITMDSENLLAELKSQSSIIKNLTDKEILQQKVSTTSPDLKKIIDEANNHNLSIVRAMPEVLQAVIDKRSIIEKVCSEADPVKKLIIYESGIALGIIVGKTTRQEVIEIMKDNSKSILNDNEPFYFYNDISLSVFFDGNNIVTELTFGNKYKGKTSKGLSIGDTVDIALEMYGQPKLKSPRGAIWDKFAIFCEKNIITSIRIQK